MSDPEFDKEANRRKIPTGRGHGKKFLGFALVAFLGLCLFGFPFSSRRPYTCAVCRMDRVDQGILGLKWSTQEETDCSRWYESNVERNHIHSWIERTHCRRFGIPGLYGGYGCRIGGPLTGLSRTVQMEIYRHFEDRLEAKQLFIRLGQTDGECYRTLDALMEWVGEDYPGTWHDWWEEHRANDEE
jgi:hypothetical protein